MHSSCYLYFLRFPFLRHVKGYKRVRQTLRFAVVIGFALVSHSQFEGRFALAEQPVAPQVQHQVQHQAQHQKVITPSPGEVLRPFDGQDLSGVTTWLQNIGTEDTNNVYSLVKSDSKEDDDPKKGSASSKKEGASSNDLRISGVGMGYLATLDSYENYHLSLEYRWGEKIDGSGYVRNSGILLHASGPDGNAQGIWMASIECQLAQGCEGDLIVIRGKNSAGEIIPVTMSSSTIQAKDGMTRWSPTGKKTIYSEKQFWWSHHQVDFGELLDTRGKDDVASPLGEWTRVDCLCRADRITIKINGVTVNECEDVFPSSGKILLENEGNEIFFRNIEIRPLSPSDK